MSRKLRIEYPGAMYHVMNRGDQREDIFRDDEDRQRLLCTLSEACRKTDWQVHAYCLMRNHGGNYGAQRQETDRQKAERVVKEEVGRLTSQTTGKKSANEKFIVSRVARGASGADERMQYGQNRG